MSVRVKQAAAALLAPVGALRFCGALRGRSARQSVLLLGYHRILPLPAGVPHEGDVELVSATPTEFAWQVQYLSRRFEPVTFAQIADAFDGTRALPKRAIALTFDDGFADLYDFAFPILRKTGMPATVFVATDYVDQAGPFWFDLIAWLIMHVPVGTVRVPLSPQPLPADPSASARRAAAAVVLKWLKTCDEPQRTAAVAALCEEFPEITARGSGVLGRALSWQQMREMASGGIEFGSHTASHRCLAKLTQNEVEHELATSRTLLEAQLRAPVTALAYPFGGQTAFNDVVIGTARQVGYRVATTYIPGVNNVPLANRFALRRQHVERYTSRGYFEAVVNLPELFA